LGYRRRTRGVPTLFQKNDLDNIHIYVYTMDQFKTYLVTNQLAETTIKNHLRNLTKVDLNLLDGDEDVLIHYVHEHYTIGSQQKTISSSISKYRTYKNLPRDKIGVLLKKANDDSTIIQQKNNDERVLPDMNDVKTLMVTYYKKRMFKEYAIMFLLLNLQTRNLDLVATVTHDKSELDDKTNWLYVRKNDIVFIRNNYKTKATYGTKKDVIRNKMFYQAVSQIPELLRSNENLLRSIMKITGNINETTLMKMSVCNNNNLKGLMKISKNRGTTMGLIGVNYDCTKS
jgi:hypothetical protein